MTKKNLLTLIFYLVILESFGHGEDLSRISIHIPITYDLKNSINNVGLECNFNLLYFNGGIEYRFGEYMHQNKNSLNLFVGAGILQVTQLQIGYSTNNYGIIRLRTEWRLSDFGLSISGNRLYFLENISIKADVERTVFTDKNDWFFSFGIGYSWNLP